jgi:hypothetical protein
MCSFCGGDVAEFVAGAPERAMPTERLGRALLFTFAAASVGTVACGGETDPGRNGDAGRDATAPGSGGEMSVPLYGLPPPPSGGTTGAGGAGAGGINVAPPYGIPPPPPTGGTTGAGGQVAATGGASSAGGADGAGGINIFPPYGVPPPRP